MMHQDSLEPAAIQFTLECLQESARQSGYLASRLANVIRQSKNLVLAIFKKIPYTSFYNCCIVLCTISGFSNIKAV